MFSWSGHQTNDPLGQLARAKGAAGPPISAHPRRNGARLHGRSADANRPNRSPPQPGLPEGFAGHLHVFGYMSLESEIQPEGAAKRFRAQVNDEKKK